MRELKAELCRHYKIPADKDIYLHFLLPLQKSLSIRDASQAKLYATFTCKIFFADSDPGRHLKNTGYVGKILLSLPYFVLYSMPASGYVFLVRWLLNNEAKTGLSAEDLRTLQQLRDYRVFEYVGRSCDLTNHQPILVARFLARTEADVRFFKQVNRWHFLVDSHLLHTALEDFEIQEQLNMCQTISLDELGRSLDRIVDQTGRTPVFGVSFKAMSLDGLFYKSKEHEIGVLAAGGSGEYYATSARILNVSVNFRQNYPDSVFVRSIRTLWHSLFRGGTTSFPSLDDFLFVSCTFDIEVGCIPLDQCKCFPFSFFLCL
ncbi:MAG: hypothetical protein E6Q06_02050 [Candidatus Moraniibacteriota bacterium]|nr:MAG: hypothetical protein E6Q06_02050 [Candidatus Moranbacteria bacterium]